MTMRRKPSIDGIDTFINDSKDEKMSNNKIDISSLLQKKPKTFPINMPPLLHEMATEAAAKQFPKISLHDYILIAIKEKIENETK